MRRSLCIISCYFISAVIFISCGDPPEPYGGIDSPVITFVTASETTFTSSTVTLQWQEFETARIFDYRLDYVSTSTPNNWTEENNWTVPPDGWADQNSWSESDTTSETSVEFYDLDEGVYRFYINGRFDPENIGDEHTLLFTVDAISGPALRIYPISQSAHPGDSITVHLYFEEVPADSAVTGLHVDIHIDPVEFEFIPSKYKNGNLISGFSGTTIWPSPSYNDGTMSIDGVADENGVGLYGTGSIVEFHLKVSELATEGTLNINIGESGSFLNIDGDPIDFKSPVGGLVNIIEVDE